MFSNQKPLVHEEPIARSPLARWSLVATYCQAAPAPCAYKHQGSRDMFLYHSQLINSF